VLRSIANTKKGGKKMSRNEKKKEENNQSGITLVALVITVIILLILAGVSMSLITGEEGLFVRAKRAGHEYEIAQRIEAGLVTNIIDYMEMYDDSDLLKLQAYFVGNDFYDLYDYRIRGFVDNDIISDAYYSIKYINYDEDNDYYYKSILYNNNIYILSIDTSTFKCLNIEKINSSGDLKKLILYFWGKDIRRYWSCPIVLNDDTESFWLGEVAEREETYNVIYADYILYNNVVYKIMNRSGEVFDVVKSNIEFNTLGIQNNGSYVSAMGEFNDANLTMLIDTGEYSGMYSINMGYNHGEVTYVMDSQGKVVDFFYFEYR